MLERLPEALDGLDERSRFIVRKRFYEGKTQKEVAEELGISPRSVYRNLEEIYPNLEKTLTTF